MRIPTTDENIRKLMGSDLQHSSIERSRMRDGAPLFTQSDVVAEGNNSLDIELRYVFDHFQIGKNYFNDKSVEYFRSIGHSKEKAKSDTQNLIRTLEKGSITDNRFTETLRALGFEIVDRSVTIRDDIGDLHTFSTSQALKECERRR